MSFSLYEAGDIVLIQNIRFKDTNSHDIRINGRPSIIIHTTPEYIYFLTISKNEFQQNEPLKYFELQKDGLNKLYLDKSYVNLSNIYRDVHKNYIPHGFIRGDIFSNLLKCLSLYQEGIKKDEYYDELVNMKVISTLKMKITPNKK